MVKVNFLNFLLIVGTGSKVNRRRNEISFPPPPPPPLESRKAEMTSAVASSSCSSGSRGNNQNKLATATTTANPNNLQLGLLLASGGVGGRSIGGACASKNSSNNSSSNYENCLVRASVVVETSSRVEAVSSSAPCNAISLPSCPLVSSPSTASSSFSSSLSSSCKTGGGGGGGARNHSNICADPTTNSSVLALSLPTAISSFHSAPTSSRIVADNPDLKIQPQGSRGATATAVANAPTSPQGTELAAVLNGNGNLTQLVAAGAGSVDTVDSSSVCGGGGGKDNYSLVVFDYPTALTKDKDSYASATHHHTQVVEAATAAVATVSVSAVARKEDSLIMGPPPTVKEGFTLDNCISGNNVTDMAAQQCIIKEDDLLDDFFKFVSNGKLPVIHIPLRVFAAFPFIFRISSRIHSFHFIVKFS